ncbi:hypothetical protein NQ318_006332 [Aromia moschata]|uniref:Cationic amino acid transporter C-terminal domain-containing protein n=1 Tax=Aromia moschata TaxID=1265417 RepID=A0AAV8XY79_9CUCU|nr:hypothetical protein NQ318_006332 [Aromia moschata]
MTLLSFGVKESSTLNNLFTVLNLATICIVLVAGAIKADINNWKISPSDIEPEYKADAGSGGFLPFGYAGIMAGAAKCFYGFVGFDAVATTGEEAKNPQRDIPPRYCHIIDYHIRGLFWHIYSFDHDVALLQTDVYDRMQMPRSPHVFDEIGWTTIKWIVTCGAVFALCTSLLGAMFPLPRVIYAMANDGIIFKPLAKVNAWTKTPLFATIVSGVFSGIMATLFDLDQLIDMMSIGTLLAYTIVAVCVLILRYEMIEAPVYPGLHLKENEKNIDQSLYNNFKEIFNLHNNKYPTAETSRIVNWSIVLYSIFTFLFCAIVIYGQLLIFSEPFYLVGFVISIVVMIGLLVVIARQPVADVKLSFKVPLVPFIPCLSVLFNVYLMLQLDLQTWIRFAVWLIIGFLIYFFYGITYSAENPKRKSKSLASNSHDREVTKF